MKPQSRNYQENEVVNDLAKKQDVYLDFQTKTVNVDTTQSQKGDIGIRTKGKISFLTKYCGWKLRFSNTEEEKIEKIKDLKRKKNDSRKNPKNNKFS